MPEWGPFSFDRKEPEPKSLDSTGFYSSSGSYSSPSSSNGSRSRSGRLGIVRPSSVLGTKRSGFYAEPSSPSKRRPSTNSQNSQRASGRPMSRFPRCPTSGSSAHVDVLYEVPEDSDNPYEYDSSAEYVAHPSNLPSTDTSLALTRHVQPKPETEPRGPFVTPEDSKYPRFHHALASLLVDERKTRGAEFAFVGEALRARAGHNKKILSLELKLAAARWAKNEDEAAYENKLLTHESKDDPKFPLLIAAAGDDTRLDFLDHPVGDAQKVEFAMLRLRRQEDEAANNPV